MSNDNDNYNWNDHESGTAPVILMVTITITELDLICNASIPVPVIRLNLLSGTLPSFELELYLDANRFELHTFRAIETALSDQEQQL